MIGRLRNEESLRQAERIYRYRRQMNDRGPMNRCKRSCVWRILCRLWSAGKCAAIRIFLILAILSMTIPCLNIGSLFLAQAASAGGKGIRVALGAGKGQLLRQLLTKASLWPSLPGCRDVRVLATLGVFVNTLKFPRIRDPSCYDWRVAPCVGLSW